MENEKEGLTEEQKLNSVKEFIEFTCQHILTFFKMLELKTHIDCQMYNEPTDERFIFRFYKVGPDYVPHVEQLVKDNMSLTLERDKLREENENLCSVMIAAAEEIQSHWHEHCDNEGYGPANLVHRLEKAIPANYPGYKFGAFTKMQAEIERLTKENVDLYRRVVKNEFPSGASLKGVI